MAAGPPRPVGATAQAFLSTFLIALMLAAGAGAARAAERAIDKEVVVNATLDQAGDARTTRVTQHHTGWGDGGQWDAPYAYFDRAWGNVLGNLKKRFEVGPDDWTEWLKQLEAWRARAAAKAAALPAAGR